MYTYTHTHIYIYTYIHTYIRIHVYILMYAYIHIHTCMHTYTHTCTHTYTHMHIYIYIYIYIYIRLVSKMNITCLNSNFSFSLTSFHKNIKAFSSPYYLHIIGKGIIGFILFPKVLELCGMLTVSPMISFITIITDPIRWGCRIHRLLLCRGVRTPNPSNECPGYDTKQSNGETIVMLEQWGMLSASLLPLLPNPFWPGVGAPDRVLSMGQIELNCVLMLKWIVWNSIVYMYKNGFGIK